MAKKTHKNDSDHDIPAVDDEQPESWGTESESEELPEKPKKRRMDRMVVREAVKGYRQEVAGNIEGEWAEWVWLVDENSY